MIFLGNFKYVATTKDGKKLSGVVTTADKAAAMRKIREENPGATITSVAAQSVDLNVELTPPKIDVKALAFACSQFKILLKAGLPLVRSIEVIAEQSTDKVLGKVFGEIAPQVAAGVNFADCLAKASVELPTVFVETVRAGQESGTMENSFETMETYFTKAYKLKAKVKSALSYPMIMVVVAVAVVNIIVVFALPSFIPMFGEGQLPGPTQFLLDYYYFAMDYWWVMVIIVIVLIVLFKLWVKTESGASMFAVFSMKAPIFGNINELNAASQFSNTLSTMLNSGLSVVQSLEITAKVITNEAVANSIKASIKNVLEGDTIANSLKKHTMLPKLLLEMIDIGEASGSLEETLSTIGAYYDDEADVTISNALAKIEPLMTIVMGIVIGFIMIALYMPIFLMSV